MKVVAYDGFWKLNNCKKIIGVFKYSNKTNTAILFIKNGLVHNTKSYAFINKEVRKQFFYKNESYDNINNTKSWIKFIKQLKHKEKLNIFK